VLADGVSGLDPSSRGDGKCGDGFEVLVVGDRPWSFINDGVRGCRWWDYIRSMKDWSVDRGECLR
jgi:hypothetical protein